MSTVSKNWNSSYSVFKRAIIICLNNFWLSLALIIAQVLVLFLVQGGVILLAEPLGDGLFSLAIVPQFFLILFAFLFQTFFVLVAMRMAKRFEGSKQLADFWKRFLPVLALGSIIVLGVSFAGVFAIIPGVILFVWWSLALPILVYEKTTVLKSLKQSYRLVKGAGWPVFQRFVFIAFIELIFSTFALVPSVGFVVSVLLSISLGLVTLVYMALIYEDLLLVKSTPERSVLKYSFGKKLLVLFGAIIVFGLLPIVNSLGDFVARIYANGSPTITNVELAE